MKNNEFFEVHCNINHNYDEEPLKLNFPMSLHPEFQLAVSNTNTEAMGHLTELFAEFAELDNIKRQTFQALVEKRADQISSFVDMLSLLKATRLCNVFFGN